MTRREIIYEKADHTSWYRSTHTSKLFSWTAFPAFLTFSLKRTEENGVGGIKLQTVPSIHYKVEDSHIAELMRNDSISFSRSSNFCLRPFSFSSWLSLSSSFCFSITCTMRSTPWVRTGTLLNSHIKESVPDDPFFLLVIGRYSSWRLARLLKDVPLPF